jgi:hypothetical protein
MYLVQDDRLELQAFAGPPIETPSVPLGRTVESDLEVLVCLHEQVLGSIAIKTGIPAFSDAEKGAVREVADALAVLL